MRRVLALCSCRALPSFNTTATSGLTRPTIITSHSRLQALAQNREQPKRKFHWTSALVTVTDGTRDLVLGLHNVTGTPWYITIPLLAVSINIMFRLPGLIHQRCVLKRRMPFAPVVKAWATRHAMDYMQETRKHPEGRPRVFMEAEVLKRSRQTEKRIYAQVGAQTYKLFSSVLGLPFWLLGIDALRRIVGAPGFLSMALRRSQASQNGNPTDGDALQSPPAAIFDDASPINTSSVEATNNAVSHAISHANPVLDPALTTEGTLWFTDLTVADPYTVLPFVLSGLLVLNTVPKGDSPFLKRLQNIMTGENYQSKWRLRLHRGLMAVGLAIGPLTMTLPAALHLYWISSSITSFVMGRAVERIMPLGPKQSMLMPKGLENPFIKAYPAANLRADPPRRATNAAMQRRTTR